MPVVSMFFGIVVRMYYLEHEPAHFHAEYSGRWAVFDLVGEVMRGDLGSRRARRLVRMWALRNRSRLEANWRRGAAGEAILPIPPLE
jgi:hypothetical protein